MADITSEAEKISNRKLYRLALGMVVSTGFFLAYLVYSDVYGTRVDSAKYSYSDTRIDGAKYQYFDTRNRIPAHDHIQRDLSYQSKVDIVRKPISVHAIPKLDHAKISEVSKPPILSQHSTITSKPFTLKKSLQTPHYINEPQNGKSTLTPVKVIEGIPVPKMEIKTAQTVANFSKGEEKDKRYLIYLCHYLTWCGGWGDRQRGMTSAYFLSKAVGREFKIIMTTPCNLSKFYRPHKMNWLWDSRAVSNTSFIISDIFSKSDFRSLLSNGDFNSLYPQKVVYIKTNHDYYSILMKNPHYTDFVKTHKVALTKKGRFKWAWNDMMQPSPYLLQRLQNVVGTDILVRKGLIPPIQKKPTPEVIREKPRLKHLGGSTLICAHVRMGRNPTIPMDEDFDSIKPSDIPKLQNFLLSKDKTGDARFFVATDFEGVRTEFRKFFGDKLIDYGGKILHIDRQRRARNSCVGFEVALLDQLILSVCDVLVVSRSGFSIHASHVGNRTEPVYIMEDGSISVFKI